MSDTKKIAVVTGGSRGIGKAVALKLAEDGYAVMLTYVSRPEAAEQATNEIIAAGGSAKAFFLDVADRSAVGDFFHSLIKETGTLDVLVNNAGMTKDGLIIRMSDEDWDRVLAVNLTGAFACLKEAAKIMLKKRKGRIINISSVVAQSGNAGQANYVAAKAGLIGLTKSAALELASRGITVNAVTPGFVDTDMTVNLSDELKKNYVEQVPLRRVGMPKEIACLVSFLASDAAAYITGQIISINGGLYM